MSTSFIYRDPFTHTKHQVSAPDAATYVVVKNNGEKKSDSDVLGFLMTTTEHAKRSWRS